MDKIDKKADVSQLLAQDMYANDALGAPPRRATPSTPW